jgi:thiol-disulfide isomerase/thioredoxin
MSGLLFLSIDDFKSQSTPKGSLMCSEISGFSLILFYSTACNFCQKMIPIFKSLPGSLSGCQFGMINVSKNKDIIKMSKETIAPITYVPYVILYHQGRPYMRYDGPADLTEIQNFIIEVANSIQSRQSFVDDKKDTSKSKEIPAFTVGIPKPCDREDVCYLEYDDAYVK